MNEIIEKQEHSLLLENRKMLKLKGVVDVDTFNETEIHAKTTCGRLLIKGTRLHIDVLDLKSGCLTVNGEIEALVYSSQVTPKSRFKRMFS